MKCLRHWKWDLHMHTRHPEARIVRASPRLGVLLGGGGEGGQGAGGGDGGWGLLTIIAMTFSWGSSRA